MKILKLELQNINSLKSSTPFVIDFEDEAFSTTGLFAITGLTGSGKTTILDAITIALYREVPRFNAPHIKLGLSDVVSEGAGEAMARITFSNKGKKYEAFWSMRIKTKTGRILSNPQESVRLKDLSRNIILAEKIKEFDRKIEEVTQLSYRQFLRSMMLAQGEFASFLKANRGDKVELLDQIIGNDIYKRIGYGVFDRKNIEKKNLNEIEQKINIEDLLTDEYKQELDNERKIIGDDLKNLQAVKNRIREILNWFGKYESLQKEKANIERENGELEIAYGKNREILELLMLHSKAKPFGELLHEIKFVENAISDNSKNLDELLPIIQKLQESINAVSEEFNAGEKELSSAKKQQEIWMPKLDIVTGLDRDINNYSAIIKGLRQEIDDINIKLNNLRENKANGEKQIEKWGDKIKAIDNYLLENKNIPEIEKNFVNWSVELKKRIERKTAVANANKNISQYKEKIENIDTQINKKENDLELKKKLHQESWHALKLLNQQIAAVNPSELNREYELLNTKRGKLKESQRLSREIALEGKKKAESDTKAKKYKEEIATIKNELPEIDKEIEKTGKEFKDIEYTLNLERKVKSLEDERKKLQEGEACPLCGSQTHPFIEKYENFNFSHTQEKYSKWKKLLEDLKEKKNIQQNSLAKLQAIYDAKIANSNDIIENISHKIREYENLNIDIQYTENDKLNSLLKQISTKIEEIRESIEKAVKLQSEINKKTDENGKAKTDVDNLKNEISILKTKKEGFLINIKEEENELSVLETQLKKLENDMENQLLDFDMQMPEIAYTTDFLKDIEGRINIYKENNESKKRLQNEVNVLGSEIKGLAKSIEEEVLTLDEKKKREETIKENLQQKREERNRLLEENISVESKRKELSDAIILAEKRVNKNKKELDDLVNKLSSNNALKEKYRADINKEKEKLDNLSNQLIQKLIGSEFSSREEVEAALLEVEKVKIYSDIKQSLEDKKLTIKTKQEQIAKDEEELNKKHNFDESKEDAQTKLQEYEKQETALNNRIGAIEEKFTNDIKLRKRNESIMEEMEKQKAVLKKWTRLLELIGGTKDSFNIYVQRLTLKSLINHANLHLEKLNDRYSLQIADDISDKKELSIELIDHYQTDMVRPVETCSGGESFLLSLSLALGLSDIASRNVKVESLFIDEGFGTLDDNLLETVISTLETLHSEGKTIGVISHVEKLKERISTQIQVHKRGNGISEIEISM